MTNLRGCTSSRKDGGVVGEEDKTAGRVMEGRRGWHAKPAEGFP